LTNLSARAKYRMTNTTVAIAGLLMVGVIASAQAASVLTIDDAVALALKGNRHVQSAALDVFRAKEESAALKTTRLPQFQIYVLSGELLRQVTFTVPQGTFGTFAATGPIPAQNQTVQPPLLRLSVSSVRLELRCGPGWALRILRSVPTGVPWTSIQKALDAFRVKQTNAQLFELLRRELHKPLFRPVRDSTEPLFNLAAKFNSPFSSPIWIPFGV
jgi:hypothetical protein